MAKKTIKFSLSSNSVKEAIKEIQEYKNEVNAKMQNIIEDLYNIGISVAKQNTTGTFEPYIVFSKEVHNVKGISKISFVASSGTIQSQYIRYGDIETIDISPLLMIEFGSGLNAQNPNGIEGVGQGALNTHGHAFDKDGWYFMDLNGNWIHSYGYKPKAPMLKASTEMKNQILTVVRKYFK